MLLVLVVLQKTVQYDYVLHNPSFWFVELPYPGCEESDVQGSRIKKPAQLC